MWKNYMLKCLIKEGNKWNSKDVYFYTEEEMISFVRESLKENKIKIIASFKLGQLDSSIFLQ